MSRLLAALAPRPPLDRLGSDAWTAVAAQGDPAGWEAALLGLLDVNPGAACIAAVLRLRGEAGALAGAARGAAEICRYAGAAAAIRCIEAWDRLRVDAVWAGFERLAREAPECLALVIKHSATILQAVGGEGFADFVAVGLKSAGRRKAARVAFFALESPAALQALSRAAGSGFAARERALKLYAAALWGRLPQMRPLPLAPGRPPPRRASVSDGVILLPDAFPGMPAVAQGGLFRAATAHAVAHLMAGAPRQKVGSLKPLQLALIGVVEDARVEAIAMRRFPGLRRLWSPYHVAQAEGGTAPALLARIARALFDPSYEDSHGVVAKARALVDAAGPFDPAASRRIGGLLGNDFGQMRVQFNARDYVVEPAYRDDGLGLWDFGPRDGETLESLDLIVEAARSRPEEGEGRVDPAQAESAAARARSAPSAGAEGAVLARYPEWDRSAGIERADWTCVREAPALVGNGRALAGALEAVPEVRRRVARLVRASRNGRQRRGRRQADGLDLDIDAVLDAEIARGAGEVPSERVYRGAATRMRDLATVVLVDVSESTRAGGVIETERLAVAVLAEAMEGMGDSFAVMAFASEGREQVRLARIKGFSEPFGAAARGRLSGLSPGLSTRLGAALRHSGAELATLRSYRRLVLVLTDGEPSDIDVLDPLDLVEDGRRAVLGLRARGVDAFAVVLGTDGIETAARMFGRSGCVALRRLEDLPARLSDVYFRLSRR